MKIFAKFVVNHVIETQVLTCVWCIGHWTLGWKVFDASLLIMCIEIASTFKKQWLTERQGF